MVQSKFSGMTGGGNSGGLSSLMSMVSVNRTTSIRRIGTEGYVMIV